MKINTTWRTVAKDNPREMWKMINYKENDTKKKPKKINEKVIQEYFKSIFQAQKLQNNPTIDDIKDTLITYHVYIPLLDDDFTVNELNEAIRKNGNGFGLDSIDKKIANVFTVSLRKSILNFFNHIFGSDYAAVWRKQLLRPEKKKGHSEHNPKLRGVAISQVLPTLYDIMIYNRFNQWYTPNIEQAGFREKQGCILQIFAIYVVMEFVRSIGKSLYIGFLDYEKAFDFINWKNIVSHLMERGAGARFTRAIANMYEETSYIPKVCNRIGDAIVAKHGVTQGRQSSTSLFSFEVKELAKNVDVPESCLYGFNVFQLADDTALLAEAINILCQMFGKCLQFSDENFMFANIDKTYFLHLQDDPDTHPIQIDDNTTISAAELNEYIYLGVIFVASNNILRHIKRNLQNRAFQRSAYTLIG